MRKIGEGYWYNVFEISDTQVIKLEKTYLQKVIYVFRIKKKQPLTFLKTAFRFVTERHRVFTIYRYISRHVDLSLLANPVFLKGIDYKQDKVKQLEDVFALADVVDQKELIDKYIEHILICVQYGFFDCKFNFLENNGVIKEDTVVLHDFNEVTLNKECAKQLIEVERWRYSYSMRCLSDELREYAFEEIRKHLTARTIDDNWAIAV